MEHTKGEWHIGSVGIGASKHIVIRDHKDPQCGYVIGTLHANSPNAEANARLIAAAPALLDELKQVVFLEKTNMTKKQVQLQIDRIKILLKTLDI